ncbi:MAG: hypothetical protein WBP38_01745 [Hyphomicrobium sp.]|jgi:hypothetical protein|nr:hypothetical protein [Hyphomicrobium sp.]
MAKDAAKAVFALQQFLFTVLADVIVFSPSFGENEARDRQSDLPFTVRFAPICCEPYG